VNPEHQSGITYQLLVRPPRGVRFRGFLPGYGATAGSGWRFGVFTYGTRFVFETVGLAFFQRSADAATLYRDFVAKADPALLSAVRRGYLVRRNVFIDWGTVTSAPEKRVRSIILGCLRNR
jgi:hypothetical protein